MKEIELKNNKIGHLYTWIVSISSFYHGYSLVILSATEPT